MVTIRNLMLALAVAAVLAGLSTAGATEEPRFKLGFEALAEQIPEIVGRPVEAERYDAQGDSVQRTTTGLMAWRKADNWTAFTDGHRTWVSGPEGPRSRLNSERFGWDSGAAVADQGIDPRHVTLDTRGVPFPSYRVDLVPGSAYDVSTPPGPKGLPEHLRIGFGLIDQPGARHAPAMYLIPAADYAHLWEQSGNSAVANVLGRIRELGQGIPSPVPIRGMPFLPYEETGGVNDLAVQVKPVVGAEHSALGAGFRYVGRFAQDANPVANDGRLRYLYQGFTRDGRYLVAFSCRVYTSALPAPRAVPAEAREMLANDYHDYMQGMAAMLDNLPGSAWEVDLEQLDAFVGSLRFEGPDLTREPFSLDFVKGIAWSEGRVGHDPRLPGYHLAGDIGVLRIQPIARPLPDRLVLAIATTPNLPPMLEGFVLRAADVSVRTHLGKAGGPVQEQVTDGSGTRLLAGGTYLRLATAGPSVLVEFLPKAMELLNQPCTVEWVDWYR